MQEITRSFAPAEFFQLAAAECDPRPAGPQTAAFGQGKQHDVQRAGARQLVTARRERGVGAGAAPPAGGGSLTWRQPCRTY